MPRIRIVTYNIGHGRGLAPLQGMTRARRLRYNLIRIARLLRELKPDVVALQEIDENSVWAGGFDQLEFLRRHGRFGHAVYGINNRRAGLLKLNYGNAILAHHPITESENIPFGLKTMGEKGFLYAEVVAHGRRVPVVNLHLHFLSRQHRMGQVGRLFDYLIEKQTHRAVHWGVHPIVCGDFNTPRGPSDATAKLLGQLDHFGTYALHPASGSTFPSPLPRRTLDFVFVPQECRVVREEIVRSMLSDHRPVVVDLELP